MNNKAVKIQAGLPKPGTVIDGRYELLDLLGRGGFGAVYLARQISMDRNVALKILLTQALNMDEMVQRFRREVMAIRNLSHPNTIQIYDFNKSESGFLYYAMEAVKGPTLKQVIKEEGPISPIRVKKITKQILKSLSEAHASRIVHRDLKPANIMLAEMHGETDFVKVLDFGIAKLLDSEDDEEHLTNAGVLIGTISYMSPEQITSSEIGPTTDIYALGLIGIEMLSGISVFAKSGKWEILNKQISSEPIDVPDFIHQNPIGRIFVKAISKDPAHRFQSALEMIHALDAITQPVSRPLVLKGWAGPDVKKGLKSSISHSGPISVSSASIAKTPSEPIAISPDSLEAIPMLDDNDVMEGHSGSYRFPNTPSGSQHTPLLTDSSVSQSFSQPYPNPITNTGTFSQTSNSQVITDAGFQPPQQKSTNKWIILGVLLIVVLVVVGGILFAYGNTDEPKTDPGKIAPGVVVADSAQTKPKREVEEVPQASVKIRVTGPKGAHLFDETGDKLIGELPFHVDIREPTTFQVRAKGFVPKMIVISPASSEVLDIKMKNDDVLEKDVAKKNLKTQPSEVENTLPKTNLPKKKSTQKKIGSSKKRTESSKDVEKKPETTPKKSPGSDWVPIKIDSKKKEKKKVKKNDVPVF